MKKVLVYLLIPLLFSAGPCLAGPGLFEEVNQLVFDVGVHQVTGADAAETARGRQIAYLNQARPPGLVIGQNAGAAASYNSIIDGYRSSFSGASARLGGRVPLISGVTYGVTAIDPGQVEQANRILIGHWRRGGWVEVTFLPRNPCTGGDNWSREGGNYASILQAGTPAHASWMKELKIAADGLEQLQEAGVAVLFRPMNEMNGDWFWWSKDRMPAQDRTLPKDYIALWQQIHDYLTRERNLRNLIWIYAPNAKLNQEIRPVGEYYPGPELVDVVGLSVYVDRLDASTLNAAGGYDQLVALGKPFVITELGPADRKASFDGLVALEAVLKYCPQARYVSWWQSWSGHWLVFSRWQSLSIVDNPGGPQLLADPRVKSLEWK